MLTDTRIADIVREGIGACNHVCGINGINILLRQLTERPAIEAYVILRIFMMDGEWQKHEKVIRDSEEWRIFVERHKAAIQSYLEEEVITEKEKGRG